MDLSEFLMMEHSDIRLIINTGFLKEINNFRLFNDFLVHGHITVEEKVYFPTILDYDCEDEINFSELVKRVKNKHKLLETLSTNMINRDNLFNLRLPLFCKMLEYHNSLEEQSIFSRGQL